METWYTIDINENEEENPIKEYDITSTPNDFNISTIFNLIDNGIIKMPPFQRNYVWDIKRASKLIESVILGLPIPQVFLYEKGKNNFFVIDGQQRLMSIYFFVKQRFPTKEGRDILRDYVTGSETLNSEILSNDDYFTNFSLRLPSPVPSETNKFNKLKYETLGEYKHTFDFLRTMRSVVIKQNEPDDQDSSMYEIFNRLNTGGQNLTSQEIRMSLFYSKFYEMLFIVNKNEKWRNLIGQENVDIHFKDIEILVRSFAMLFFHKDYKATMNRFINKFSKLSNQFDEDTIDYLKKLFLSFLESCNDLQHNDFQSGNKKFNISLFEVVFVSTCEEAFQNKKLINGIISKESVDTLKSDSDFINATRDGIASKANVTLRMKRALEIIKVQ